MQSFLARHRHRITGVLSGFDRLVFRGSLRQLSYCDGMLAFLSHKRILLKDFRDWAIDLTSKIVRQSEAVGESRRYWTRLRRLRVPGTRRWQPAGR